MKLITWPHDILITKLPLVEKVTDEHLFLTKEMIDVMYQCKGVGLAANQVNYPFQIFVMAGHLEAFINPTILMQKGVQRGSEGCLSMPGLTQPKARFNSLKLRYTNLDGQTITRRFTGLEARIVQHEVDHLNGILCLTPPAQEKNSGKTISPLQSDSVQPQQHSVHGGESPNKQRGCKDCPSP